MYQPKRTKYRKYQKGRICLNAGNQTVAKNNKLGFDLLKFGTYGLQQLEGGRLSVRQMEAGRRVITRTLQRNGKLWISLVADYPVTEKPTQVRMGKGKGNVQHWVVKLMPGKVIYELQNVQREMAYKALMSAAKKMPMKCRFVERR